MCYIVVFRDYAYTKFGICQVFDDKLEAEDYASAKNKDCGGIYLHFVRKADELDGQGA